MTYELQSVRKRYGLRVLALRDVSLAIRSQEFLVVYGPAGAGKSTLLNILAGITTPTSGDVLRDGRSILHVPPERRDAAMAFENYALYSHLSVFENLAFPLRARGTSDGEVRQRVHKIAEVLGIGHVLERRPGFLSGGQRQRVALGRAIIRPADIYLLDEPIGHLDAKLRHRMRAELKALAQDLKATVVFTTTSSREALGLADRIAVLHRGTLRQVGTPAEVYHRPADDFVASFVGDPPMSLLSAEVEARGDTTVLRTSAGHAMGQVPAAALRDLDPKQAIRVGIRANRISLTQPGAPDGIPGQVTSVEHLGYADIAIVAVGEDQLSISVPSGQRLRHGEPVALKFAERALHVFLGQRAVHHAEGLD